MTHPPPYTIIKQQDDTRPSELLPLQEVVGELRQYRQYHGHVLVNLRQDRSYLLPATALNTLKQFKAGTQVAIILTQEQDVKIRPV